MPSLRKPTCVSCAKSRSEGYKSAEWDTKKGRIHTLYVVEHHTLKQVVEFLEKEHFHVTESSLKTRLPDWKIGKNKTKAGTSNKRTMDRVDNLRMPSAEVSAEQDSVGAKAVALGQSTELPCQFNGKLHGTEIAVPVSSYRPLRSPDGYREKEGMLTLIAHYVSGAFETRIWNAEHAPRIIVGDYLRWVRGSTPSSLKVLSNLVNAARCRSLKGKEDWADILLKAAFRELEVFFCQQPYHALPTILVILNFFRKEEIQDKGGPLDRQPLAHCLDQALKWKSPLPVIRLLWLISAMQRRNYSAKLIDHMLTEAACRFVDLLSDQLGESGEFACDILSHSNVLLARSEMTKMRLQKPWYHPVVRRKIDSEYFNSSRNIENAIVGAVELRGYEELLQLQEALQQQLEFVRQQRDKASDPGSWWKMEKTRRILEKQLGRLEVPIHRIGCRDSVKENSMQSVISHWEQLKAKREPQSDWDLEWVTDLLSLRKFLEARNENEQVRKIDADLQAIFTRLQP